MARAIPAKASVPSPALSEAAEPVISDPSNPKSEPFAFADFTWLTGNARRKDNPYATKFFTPEIRSDANYTYDFRHPKDDTISGSSEIFRSSEVQLTQFGIGGDFHYDNVRARLMTQFGLYSQTTPRNDASPARGQWNLADAYRYVSEAYGGYHFDIQHGVNVDAGIFMSYVGLFSYYQFDNWAYLPSYVSSNTPWFFNGVRVQWFPTAKLKIEPWFINGWQSYGRFNNRPGLGGQILWWPNGNWSVVGNQYGYGEDALGVPSRTRYHTDDSVQYKYYQSTKSFISMAAASLTGDAACESGGGVSCFGNGKMGPKQSFLGFMAYNRLWFDRDRYALTIGGDASTTPADICSCRRSMERLRPQGHCTSPRIREIRTRHRMFRLQEITCRANTSPTAWSITTARRTSRTLAALEGLRRPEETPACQAHLFLDGVRIFATAKTG
jgi:hypothetical protein